jgi:hypothetical protein
VPTGRPKQRRINVKSSANHQQAVNAADIVLDQLGVMGQQQRDAARCDHRLDIVMTHRVPWVLRIAAAIFAVEGDTNNWFCHLARKPAASSAAILVKKRAAHHGRSASLTQALFAALMVCERLFVSPFDLWPL